MFKRHSQTPRLFALALLLISSIAVPVQVQATDLPDHYPATFQWLGTLNKLDLRENSIIVRDALFPLAQTVEVHTPRSRFATLQTLRVGMKVGCKIERNNQGEKVVSGIWVFPNSSKHLLPPPPMH